MWLNIAAKLVPGIIKTGMSIASNRRKAKELESVAELKLAERMANGEVEFKKAVIDSHKGDWKDEFCLVLISIPLLLLAWSVFSDDPDIQQKIDIFFDKKKADDRLESQGIHSIGNPQYPYNHATYTESGHLFELDDTRDFERVSLQHRAGTYFEWQPNGDAHNRVVGNNYTLHFGDDYVNIQGKVKVNIIGDADIAVDGKTLVEGYDLSLIHI